MSDVVPFPVHRRAGRLTLVPEVPEQSLEVTPLPDGYVRVEVVMPRTAFEAFMAAWQAGLAPGAAG